MKEGIFIFCQHCGRSVDDGTLICPSCGAPISAQPNQYQQPNYQQPNNYQQNYQQPNYQQPYQQNGYQQPAPQYPYPMNWFKFLIYFALFAGAVVNFLNAMSMFTGSQYGESKGLVYSFFPELHVVDIIVGVLTLCLAALQIYVRFQLSGFKKNGPKSLYMLYGLSMAINLVYFIAICAVANMAASSVAPSFVAGIIMNGIFLGVNVAYFKKRQSLFVN